jgi:hypothetical protein
MRSSIGNDSNKIYPNGEFIIVYLVANNQDQSAKYIFANRINLQDGQGRLYTNSDNGAYALTDLGDSNTPSSGGAQIAQPSELQPIDLVYDIPKDDSGLEVTIQSESENGQNGSIPLPTLE